MANVTPFDGFILILVFVAMYFAIQPKQAAMSVCLAVTAAGMFVNYFVDAGYLIDKAAPPLLGILEVFAATCLFIGARWLKKQDGDFFYIMGYFLVVSAAINFTVSPGWITEVVYMAFAPTIALLHVATMLMYSDGFVDIIRNIRDFVFRHSFSRLSFR